MPNRSSRSSRSRAHAGVGRPLNSASRLQKNDVVTPELHWSARLVQQKHTTQDAQKGRCSHPPNHGECFPPTRPLIASQSITRDAPFQKRCRSVDWRLLLITHHMSRLRSDNAACLPRRLALRRRQGTKPADFVSILLDVTSKLSANQRQVDSLTHVMCLFLGDAVEVKSHVFT